MWIFVLCFLPDAVHLVNDYWTFNYFISFIKIYYTIATLIIIFFFRHKPNTQHFLWLNSTVTVHFVVVLWFRASQVYDWMICYGISHSVLNVKNFRSEQYSFNSLCLRAWQKHMQLLCIRFITRSKISCNMTRQYYI